MESTLNTPELVPSNSAPRATTIVYWPITALFCLQMGFTAFAQLTLPQVAEAFAHLGFPDHFRILLSWAKLAGIALLVLPVPSRVKEWVYAGFAFDLAFAVVAHVAVGDGVDAWGWAAGTGLLWAVSYVLWRRRDARSARAAAWSPNENPGAIP